VGHPVASQFIGNKAQGFLSLALQEFSKESLRRTPVPTGLHENVDYVAVLIDGTPQILPLAVDCDEHFVQEPHVAEPALATLQTPSVIGTELRAPLPNGFMRYDNSSFGK